MKKTLIKKMNWKNKYELLDQIYTPFQKINLTF